MLQSGVAWTTELGHNGRTIQLRSVQRHDGTWACDYSILEIGITQSTRITRNDTGSFATREEAEAAAVDAAHAEIDSRGPIS